MAGFLFKLETADGKPAEPSTLSSAVPKWGVRVTRSTSATRNCGLLPCETTMQTRHRCWSLRTQVDEFRLRVWVRTCVAASHQTSSTWSNGG
jgi:hypothetical protein